jgi:hypothetical protein
MGTFGGDLLRILAHGVMNTGTTALGQYLGNMFEGERATKLLGDKAMLDAATYEQDPERQQEQLGQLKDRFNLSTVTNKGFAPVGETPSLSNLGMRKGLTYPEATYQPAQVKSIVAPVPDWKTALGAKALPALSQMTPEQALEVQLNNPDRDLKLLTLTGQLQEKALSREQRTDEKEKDRQAALERAKLHAETTTMLGQGMQSLRQQGMQLTLANQKATHAQVGDRLEAGARTQLDKALVNLEKVTKDPMATEEQIKTAIEQYNGMHGSIVAKHPDLGNYFQPLEPELSKGWGLGWGAGKVVGAKTKAGGTPAANVGVDQTELSRFKTAYEKNPELAISNAKRLGTYDKLKAVGIIK